MKVLLVGDSIMRGTSGGTAGGCRPALYDGLISDGIGHEFVGPFQTENPAGYETKCLHGAISGRKAEFLHDGGDGSASIGSMVTTYTPDLVWVQIGINDKTGGATDAQILDWLDLSVVAACAARAGLIVIVGGPADSSGATLPATRAGLPARMKAHRDAGRDARYWLGFGGLATANTHDGLHPNSTGDDLNRKELQRAFRSLAGPPARWAVL